MRRSGTAAHEHKSRRPGSVCSDWRCPQLHGCVSERRTTVDERRCFGILTQPRILPFESLSTVQFVGWSDATGNRAASPEWMKARSVLQSGRETDTPVLLSKVTVTAVMSS